MNHEYLHIIKKNSQTIEPINECRLSIQNYNRHNDKS